MYIHIYMQSKTTICQMVSLCNMQHFVINNYMFQPYKAETCSCILHIVAYYIVIPSDILLCFWLHVDVNIHIIIYIVLLTTQRGWHTLRYIPVYRRHHVIPVKNQLDTLFSMYLFISLLYMFRRTQRSSSGESNCINTSSGIYHSV